MYKNIMSYKININYYIKLISGNSVSATDVNITACIIVLVKMVNTIIRNKINCNFTFTHIFILDGRT